MATVDKISPKDSRVQSKYTTLNGREYHYFLAEPNGTPRGTIFLVHGWPDMAFGWRYQIPLLTSLGLRVVAPDMMGYARSGSPQDLNDYSMKNASDDLAALAKELNVTQIFILGHDWGGAVVWRFALWYPKLTKAVLSICTPYWQPAKQYFPLEEAVKTVVPNFRYQVQLAGPDVEATIKGKEKLKEFLRVMYGGQTKNKQPGFTTEKGVIFENLPGVGPSPLLSEEEVDFYVEMYDRNGLRGPLNWYRTRKINFEDEKQLAEIEGLKVQPPSLFVQAKKDAALPAAMAQGMSDFFVDLTTKEVNAGHWALWEKPAECNAIIKEFLEKQLGGSGAKL